LKIVICIVRFFFPIARTFFQADIALFATYCKTVRYSTKKNAYFFKPFNGFSRKPSRLFGTENILSSSDFFSRPDFRRAKKLPTPEKLGLGSFLYPENFSFETSAMQPIDASI